MVEATTGECRGASERHTRGERAERPHPRPSPSPGEGRGWGQVGAGERYCEADGFAAGLGEGLAAGLAAGAAAEAGLAAGLAAGDGGVVGFSAGVGKGVLAGGLGAAEHALSTRRPAAAATSRPCRASRAFRDTADWSSEKYTTLYPPQ